MNKLNEVKCFCKTCGCSAIMMTRRSPDKISGKEKEFECNDCVSKRWETEEKKAKQLALI